jgi:cysteine desulfurase
MPSEPIYLDYHATTPVDPRVVEAMLPYFTQKFGNPASVNHTFGNEAQEAVARSRERIATCLGARPKDLVFTSGATESNNLAIRGVAERVRRRGNHLVSVTTEHRAVLDPLERLSRREYDITLVPVRQTGDRLAGCLEVDRLAAALREDTILVSVMLANNEMGAIHDLPEVVRVCHERGIAVHCDATQGVGKLPIDLSQLEVDFLSFTAHKFYGPKGVGALYVRRKPPAPRLEPLIQGGGHEQGLRSGTLNVPGIVGMARALELCVEEMPQEIERQRRLRDRLWEGLQGRLAGLSLNGPGLDAHDARIAWNLNASFADVDGEALMMSMGRLAVSSGSACTSANPEPSHVLRAIGLSDDLTRASLRFGMGRFTTEEEVSTAIELVCEAVERLRRLSERAEVGPGTA